MGKKLAIKGHATRGSEVIKLLQMMGGSPAGATKGSKESYCYYISEDTATKYISWDYIGPEEIDKYEIFTLEEFLEEYPHKVGDKVVDCYGNSLTIKSMNWLDDLETMVYDFEDAVIVLTAEDIGVANDMGLKIENGINMNIEFDLAKYSYEIKDGKLVVSEKTPKYPDNYEECVRIAKNIHGYDINIDAPAYRGEAELFIKLLICRDAYWKIYGDEKGLGKPWKPDWLDETTKYGIQVYQNTIIKDNFIRTNCAFVFPTPEIRDNFYENFKNLIEECKEIL